MKKFAIFLILCLSFSPHIFPGEVKELERTSYYPKETEDYYFRSLVGLAIIDNSIFAVENFSHKVIALELDRHGQLKYLHDVGRPGQGPGDLMYPLAISAWNDEIAVNSSGFFSFFDKSGGFLSRFKIFKVENTFIYTDNKIYWLSPNLGENYLIEVYEKDGKRISTIGHKFINADVHAFKNPNQIVSLLYEGNIFSDGEKRILYFNQRFGDYIVFSAGGKVISKGNIRDGFGERGKIINEYNNDVYIHRTKKEGEPSRYPKSVIFEDGYLYKDKLYFICSQIFPKDKAMTIFELRVFSAKTRKPLNEYLIRKNGICRLNSFAVIENNHKLFALLSTTLFEEGHFLELYAIDQ
jgi:hypothetical protein